MNSLSIAICACTYKRPDGLRALLDGLARQTFADTPRPALHIVIADNEGSDQARQICADFERRSGIPLTYVHEPERGISFARNACLKRLPAECDFFAFIDDDEVPAPDWVDQLLHAQAKTGADVVAGRVEPVFDAGAPQWIADGRFFGSPRRSYDLDAPKLADLQELERAATNNVLVRASAVRQLGLEFDPELALCGGGDSLFFATLHKQECRIVFADRAVVDDYIPLSRANFRYVLFERFRWANVNALIDEKLGVRPVPSAAARVGEGAKHIGLGFRRVWKTALSSKRSTDRFAVGAFQAAHGLGIIAAAFGFRYQHYK